MPSSPSASSLRWHSVSRFASRAGSLPDCSTGRHEFSRSSGSGSISCESSRPPGEPSRGREANGSGAFFSGGVDSFYAALRYREQIDDLIFVHGFDIPLSGREDLRRQASEMAREAADALGKDLVEVEADIRSFSNRFVGWDKYHGSALAAIGLLMQPRYRTILVPSSMSYDGLFQWGSHPLVDPAIRAGRVHRPQRPRHALAPSVLAEPERRLQLRSLREVPAHDDQPAHGRGRGTVPNSSRSDRPW